MSATPGPERTSPPAAESAEGSDPNRGIRAPADGPAPRAAPVLDDAPLLPSRSADDSDTGWGEGPDSSDDRLLRDVPPHW
ncbi:hypothetical protein [Cellulomonas hominis]